MEGWFIIELVFHSQKGEKVPDIVRFNKQIRLIRANSSRSAYQIALVLASQELDDRNLKPIKGKSSIWEFSGISFLAAMEGPETAEGYPEKEPIDLLMELQAAREHILFLRRKNEHIQNQIAHAY